MGGIGSGRPNKNRPRYISPHILAGIPLDEEQVLTQITRRREARQDLLSFTSYLKADYKAGPHHRLISDALSQVEQGLINRLMIFLPPRHGKSELVSRKFPPFYTGRNPGRQIISASYNSDLAAEFGRDVRNTIADPLYQSIFKDVTLAADSKAADRWVTSQGGSYLAAGVGSGITGRGAHLGIIDDPFKDRKEAESRTIREGVWNWYTSTFYTRLMPGAAIILCQTRWHGDDLAGRLIKEMKRGGEQWTIINLPAIAEGGDVLGRKIGEALWPAWYPIETLLQIQQTIGTYDWLSLYQQRPTSEKGNIFKKTWWRYFREIPQFDLVIQSWDTAFKDKEENDFSVCQTWGALGNKQGENFPGFYLIDQFKDRMTFPEVKRQAVMQAIKHNPDIVLVEDKASGQSLIQELREESNLNLLAIPVDRDKIARAHAATPVIEGGRVFLPEWAPWLDDYIGVMGDFPKGEYDDDVDSTTQALNYLRDHAGIGQVMTIEQCKNLMDECRPVLH